MVKEGESAGVAWRESRICVEERAGRIAGNPLLPIDFKEFILFFQAFVGPVTEK